MTLKTTLIQATKKLKKNNTNSASLDAEILLSFILNQNKEFLYTYPDKKLTLLQTFKLKKLISRRSQNEPIAYLTHQKEFYGYNFYINQHVLVPRPLTEQMIELALQEINKKKLHDTKYTIYDIGTGSGNIIISLAKELQKIDKLDNFKFYGLDISTKALKVAKKNAKLHQVEKYITFLKSDLLNSVKTKKIDLVLANLPYLNNDDLNEPSIKKEPDLALVGNLYPRLFKQINELPHKPIVIYEDKNGVTIQ